MANTNLKRENVLLRPHITEKAALEADKNNVYVFDVVKGSTKKSVGASVKVSYGVTPVKIHFVAIPAKKVYLKGRAAQSRKMGTKGGGKKAYVYLKKGDKIELI